jgi:hypothetical protein
MKIENQNIYGGNQQFADFIINSNENKIEELDRKLLNLIYENSKSFEEREMLLMSLSDIKDSTKTESEKKVSNSFLSKFINAIPGEVGKQVVKHLIDNGADYLQSLVG